MGVQVDPAGPLKLVIDFLLRKRAAGKAEKQYLTATVNHCQTLGRDWVPDEKYRVDTEQAYVPVRMADNDGRSESLEAVLNRHDAVVIQGQPGGGKSTLIRYITLLMAKATLDYRRNGALPERHLKRPVSFPLRVLLGECTGGRSVEAVMLDAVPMLPTDYLIRQRLERGGVLILLDGLDELADAEQRFRVMSEIGQLTDRFRASGKGNRFLVTTRAAGYNHHILAGAGYALYTLQELTPLQQEDMIRRYFRLWTGGSSASGSNADWQTRANELIDQLDKNDGLRQLKSNPLLLSQIAILHFRGRAVPIRRNELYEQCIRHLLTRRERRDVVLQRELDERLILLGELALVLHQRKGCETLTRHEVEEILSVAISKRLGPSGASLPVSDLIERMGKEWGLLVNRAGQGGIHARYAFSNLIFQEFLAAYVIRRYQDDYWPVLRANFKDSWWQEVLMLYTAMSGDKVDQSSPLDQVLNEIFGPDAAPSDSMWIKAGRLLSNETNQSGQSARHEAIVHQLKTQSYGEQIGNAEALEALCQIGSDGLEFVLERILGRQSAIDPRQVMSLLQRMPSPVARQQLRESLIHALEDRPKIADRIKLAEALGQIIDTRLGHMIEVPSVSGHRVKSAFKIGRYPVTNYEYARFVEAQGWTAPSHWPDGTYPLQHANHPVVCVSLDDARAYCEWLSVQREQRYYLPTDAEWMTVAEEDEPRRLFPWGNRLYLDYFNWRRTIGSTTSVGIYLESETHWGVSDLLGNVWEWTEDRDGKQQVLRGLAWDSMDDLGQNGLQARIAVPPSVRQNNIGFRIAMK